MPPTPPRIVTHFESHTGCFPDTEWLLTMGNGGFAMGTASLLARRSYHALLVASTNPPVERLCSLVALDETVLLSGSGAHQDRFHLATRTHTDGSVEPAGYRHLRRFEKTPTSCTWSYALGGMTLTKTLSVARGRNCCAMRYRIGPAAHACTIALSPRIAMRDFHEPRPELDIDAFSLETIAGGLRISASGHTLSLICDVGAVLDQPSVLTSIRLDIESLRHLPDVDALYTPGLFLIDIPPRGDDFVFTVAAAVAPDEPDLSLATSAKPIRRLARLAQRAHEANPALAGGALDPLVYAADDFLVERVVDGTPLRTVIAGYPWFADWGRDTMIALPGLMLCTGRQGDALSCLTTFAAHVDQGMIPNRFDDYGGAPHYNTVDASLWFIHAAVEYLRATDDRDSFERLLLPACLEIIDCYQSGTRFGICMDPADALITAGDATTQLTWMDARRDGVVFTPRHGKAVEINALWHCALRAVAEVLAPTDALRSASLTELADRAARSIRTLFWNDADSCLFDCLRPASDGGWNPVAQIRPNQIFAVSLPHSPLSAAQQRHVVACVERHLLTPFGLRTLSPSDPDYQPRFEGDMPARDRAYHNGTVWPWLIGPYAQALLRVNAFSDQARAQVRELLQPLLASLGSGCLGQIAEVYDAGAPRRASGCIAQAWSVAEVLRAAILAGAHKKPPLD